MANKSIEPLFDIPWRLNGPVPEPIAQILHDRATSSAALLAKRCSRARPRPISVFDCQKCMDDDLSVQIISKWDLPPPPFLNKSRRKERSKHDVDLSDFNAVNRLPTAQESVDPVYGIYIWPDGDYYQGWWKLGQRHGRGVLTCRSGDTYTGEWKEGMYDGLGKYRWASGREYHGYYKEGMRHGSGTLRQGMANYQGKWLMGERHGFGVQIYQDLSRYEGAWDHDRPGGGHGVIQYSNGDEYLGGWVGGKPHGQGHLKRSQWHYVGQWSAGRRHGKGRLIWKNENRYEGQWKDDKQDGDGESVFVAQTIIVEDGVKYRFHQGDRHVGRYRSGSRSGPGTYYHHDGRVYDASWTSDCRKKHVKYRPEYGGRSKKLIPDKCRCRAHLWSIATVAEFIRTFSPNGDVFADGVIRHAITGQRLLQLQTQDLYDLLNVTSSDTRKRMAEAIRLLAIEDDEESYRNNNIRLVAEISAYDPEFITAKSLLLAHMGQHKPIQKVQVNKIYKVVAKHFDDAFDAYGKALSSRSDRGQVEKACRIGFYTTSCDYIDHACVEGIYPISHPNNPADYEKDRWYGDPKLGVYISRTCTRALTHLIPELSGDLLDDHQTSDRQLSTSRSAIPEPDPVGVPGNNAADTDPAMPSRVLHVVMVECFPGEEYRRPV
uniref:SAM domain-containing protein n=1 Tax=Spongospora subterranea TaxID=70186 RepID=A0A0H5RBE7_9EUKA|eukprot:CRZ11348.1 hypothetical protein [Spongospora subterranea]